MIHSETRSQKLIEKLNNLGLSISYERVLNIGSHIAASLCEQFEKDDAVIPCNLLGNTFTLYAVDNIDFNPSSTTAMTSFHGTSISYLQQPDENSVQRPFFELSNQGYWIKLPESYTSIRNIEVNLARTEAPPKRVFHPHYDGETEVKKEELWLKNSGTLLSMPFAEHHKLSFSGYHTEKETASAPTPWITGLCPMFDEKAATATMMYHTIKIVSSTISKLNPNQIPIIVGDQPIFSLLKQVQWRYPETYREDKLVIFMGGLHLEMSLWTAIGKLLNNSGWDNIVAEAEVTTPGTAESLLRAAHLKKTRLVHEISLVAFTKLKYDAFLKAKK